MRIAPQLSLRECVTTATAKSLENHGSDERLQYSLGASVTPSLRISSRSGTVYPQVDRDMIVRAFGFGDDTARQQNRTQGAPLTRSAFASAARSEQRSVRYPAPCWQMMPNAASTESCLESSQNR